MAIKNVSNHKHEVKVKTADFRVRDKSVYYVNHPASDAGGGFTDQPHILSGGSGSASHDTGNAWKVWEPSYTGDDQDSNKSWNTGWSSHDPNTATPGRLTRVLVPGVPISGIEWQGEGNTGYGPISGPRSITIRLGTTSFSNAYNDGVGDLLNHTVEMQNLDWGNNTSSPQGLAELIDIAALNGGQAITAGFIAIDCHTSWDTRNMGVRRIKLREHVPAGDLSITATVGPEVDSFQIRDGNGNTNVGSHTLVDFGANQLMLDNESVGINFKAVRVDNTVKFFGSDGSETEVIG